MKNFTAVLFIILTYLSMPINTVLGKELSFKGATLGMTLDEFKAIPVPIPEEFMTKNNYMASRIICDDMGEGLQTCQYQAQNRKNARWIDMRVGFAGLEPDIHYLGKNLFLKEREVIKSINYIFFKDRLMAIGITIGSKLFDKVLPNFISYYGKPHSSVDKSIKNPYGAQVGNIQAKWIDGDDVLDMQKFTNSASKGRIKFQSNSLMNEYLKSINTEAAQSDF